MTLRDVSISNPPGIAYPVTPDEKYFEFTLTSTDGLPLAQAKRAIISAVSTSFNSGFQLDESKMRREFQWQQNPGAMPNGGGRAPVLVARVNATVVAPALNGMRYILRDWHMNALAQGIVKGGTLRIEAKQPVFIIELWRN